MPLATWSLVPLPIADYSSDHGFGYGGVAQAVWRPVEEEPPKLTVGVQLTSPVVSPPGR